MTAMRDIALLRSKPRPAHCLNFALRYAFAVAVNEAMVPEPAAALCRAPHVLPEQVQNTTLADMGCPTFKKDRSKSLPKHSQNLWTILWIDHAQRH